MFHALQAFPLKLTVENASQSATSTSAYLPIPRRSLELTSVEFIPHYHAFSCMQCTLCAGLGLWVRANVSSSPGASPPHRSAKNCAAAWGKFHWQTAAGGCTFVVILWTGPRSQPNHERVGCGMGGIFTKIVSLCSKSEKFVLLLLFFLSCFLRIKK